jgi:hypothetical protein
MQIRSSFIVNTNTTRIIELSIAEVDTAASLYSTLANAVVAGYFSSVSATFSDIIAIDTRPEGTTIVVITERTTIPADTESNS